MKLAVVTTVSQLNPQSIKCLSLQLEKLRSQNLKPYIALGLLNPDSKLISTLLPQFDQVTPVYGDDKLFQREAIRNKVVSELPLEIEKIVFLDFQLFPEDTDWIENCEKAFEKFDAFLPFHLVKDGEGHKLLHTTSFFSGKVDPNLHWNGETLVDTALAMTRELFLKAGGLPFEDGFTGYNGAREYFQFQSKQEISVPHFLGVSKHRPLYRQKMQRCSARFGFCLSVLIHQPMLFTSPVYSKRVLQAFSFGWNIKEHIKLNSSGGLELKQPLAIDSEVGAPNLEVSPVYAEGLEAFLREYKEDLKEYALLPITKNRIEYILKNHTLRPSDIVLLVGKVNSRLASFCHLLPGVLFLEKTNIPIMYVYHAFVFHHLKPTGIVDKMFNYILSLNLNLMLCEEEPTIRRLSSVFKRIELPNPLTFYVYKNLIPQENIQEVHISSSCETVVMGPSHFLFDLKYELLNIYSFTLRKSAASDLFQVTACKIKYKDESASKIRILNSSLPKFLTEWGFGAIATYLDCPIIETTEELNNSEHFKLLEIKKRSYVLLSPKLEEKIEISDYFKASLKLSDGGCPWS